MKKVKRIIALALMMSLCFCLIGCTEKETDEFYGKWTYNYDEDTVIMQFKSDGTVNYKGTKYSYVENNGFLELTSDKKQLSIRYFFDEDMLYIYESMTYHYQGEGDANGLIGYWLADNGRSNYEFTEEGTFREDSYIPGHYVVNEEDHSILCMYNDQYYDTTIYYTLDGNTLTVDYPWAMIRK